MARAGMTVEASGRRVAVTNSDKVLYPATGTTKRDVVGYARAIAPAILPHLADRPVTRKRWVHGVGTPDAPGHGFFTKNLDSGTPDWIRHFVVDHGRERVDYPLVDDEAGLVLYAQLAALELHVPQWRFTPEGLPGRPDRLILDLDPGEGAGMDACVEVALKLRAILDAVGLVSVPVTSGSKGIHLYAGLDGSLDAAEASDLAKQLATGLEASHPDLVVSDMKKALRPGKVLLDWSQNNGSKTTLSPYSLRGTFAPFVAAPRTWDEIRPGLTQLRYDEVLRRVREIGDPLAVLLPGGTNPLVATPGVDPAVRRDDEAVVVARPAPTTAGEPGGRSSVASAVAPPHRGMPLAGVPTVEPMLATAATASQIGGDGWRYEVKWDGYRGIARVGADGWSVASRNGLDFTAEFPGLGELRQLLGNHAAVLDGEIVVLDADGRSSFELLQAHTAGRGGVHYMVFDVLWLDGSSLVGRPYDERRALLESLDLAGEVVHTPTTLGTDPDLALAASRHMQLEGVVAKRADSPYTTGRRDPSWLKVKNVRHQDAVVVGWRPDENGRGIRSLLLAVNRGGRLSYIGRAGSGFTNVGLVRSLEMLGPLERPTPAVDDVPDADARGVHWVEPTLVGEVRFSEWTSAGILRHPVWRGWRPDVAASDVVVD